MLYDFCIKLKPPFIWYNIYCRNEIIFFFLLWKNDRFGYFSQCIIYVCKFMCLWLSSMIKWHHWETILSSKNNKKGLTNQNLWNKENWIIIFPGNFCIYRRNIYVSIKHLTPFLLLNAIKMIGYTFVWQIAVYQISSYDSYKN